MHRRTFLLSTAGLAATPGTSPWTVAQLGGGPPPAGVDGFDFESWRRAFIERAVRSGFARDRVEAEIGALTPDQGVIDRDQRQPELSRPIGDYMASAISDARIQKGQGYRASLAPVLQQVQAQQGVAPEILLSIWAVESNFGQVQGGFDVIRSLATLAAEGRRREWAERQLLAALKIVLNGEAPRDRLKGSWAGAMGQTQFTPEDYLSWAVDQDGDGMRDIWGSSADALGSAGNFLAHKAAWRRDETWGREAVLPQGFDYALAESPFQPWSRWAEMGVQLAGGANWTAAEAGEGMGLILPAGWSGPAFLILPNHMAIRAYNNSTSYALAVGLLADRIAGRPPLVRPWPNEQPLTLSDRMAAQSSLNALGFDVGAVDGILGVKTRAAARAWQASRGMPADGYLTYGLIQALKLQANGATAPAAPVQDALDESLF